MDKLLAERNQGWSLPLDDLLSNLNSSSDGLSLSQVKERARLYGPNQFSKNETIPPFLRILFSQFENWLVLVLIFASLISFFLGEKLDSLIIISIVALSIVFGFLQEYRSEKTIKKLKKFISHKVRVKREGKWVEVESKDLVVGDIVRFQIGDLIPADIRLTFAHELSINEAVLTGESALVDKAVCELDPKLSQPQELKNMVFAGTLVAGGYGEGVVVAIGNDTFFGQIAASLENVAPKTEFQKAIEKFSLFLFRVILVMAVFVFIVNAWRGREIFDSFLFALALAVGITPELLPAILTITLSQGAMKMAKKKVVVKRLMSVENFGNMDTLCTDKTGTLTKGLFTLANFVNENGDKDKNVFLKALLCTNDFDSQKKGFVGVDPIDKALWEDPTVLSIKSDLKDYKILNENKFDFERRRMSVLVEDKDGHSLLIVKGAPESVLTLLEDKKDQKKLLSQVKRCEENGFRVIAVAQRRISKETSSKDDEKDLEFLGFLLFSDPIKEDAKASLEMFRQLGVKIKILSGDSVIVTKNVANQVGLEVDIDNIVTGDVLEGLSDEEIEKYALKYDFFARITPLQKYKIVAALNKENHIVGFLGDGVNDAPALKAADIGIAVDSGTSVAKEAADIILLKKDLRVLGEGIEMGRKTFGNVMKYILNTISANYGNMFTVALSSLFLKFIPLLPKQILLNNFMSDLPLFTVATDNVDPEYTKRPRRWNIKLIGHFMVFFGLLSSFFDLMLILPMVFVFKFSPEIFRTAWFVESALSEMLVTFAIRTQKVFYKSMPSKFLVFSTLFSSVGVLFFTISSFGREFFNFVSMPFYLWLWIGFVLVSYFISTELMKHVFFKKYE